MAGARRHIVTRPGHCGLLSRTVGTDLLLQGAPTTALHVDAGQVDGVRSRPPGHDFDPATQILAAVAIGGGSARGLIRLPLSSAFQPLMIARSAKMPFADIVLSVEILHFALGDERKADAGPGVKPGMPAPLYAAALASVPCGQNSTSSSPARYCRSNSCSRRRRTRSFLDLPGTEQLAEPLAVDPGIVAGDGQILVPRRGSSIRRSGYRTGRNLRRKCACRRTAGHRAPRLRRIDFFMGERAQVRICDSSLSACLPLVTLMACILSRAGLQLMPSSR